MRRVVATMAVVAVSLAACGGGSDGIVVTDARMGQPTGPNAAVYFTASNSGEQADRLIGASTDVATSVEIHESTMADDGTMGMQPVDGLDITPGGELTLEPGGYHLMLVDAERLDVGDMVEVTLNWEKAGEMTVDVEVVDPSETMDMGG